MKTNLDSVLENGALVIDASTLEGRWMVCPTSFYYYRIRKREAAKFYIGREFGKAMHAALAAYYTPGEDYLHVLDEAYPTAIGVEDHRSVDYARRLLKRYIDEFAAETYTVVTHDSKRMVEMPFAHPIGSVTIDEQTIPVIWEGKIDLVVRDANNRLFVVDHKTSIIGGDTFWSQFKLSTQQRGYAAVVQDILAEPVHGFVINALFTRRETRTGKGMEVERQPYPLEQQDLLDWRMNTLNTCADLLRACASDVFCKHTSSCVSKYGRCDYLSLCELNDLAMREAVLNGREYQPVTWRPTNES